MSVSVGARPAFNVLPTKSFDLLLTVMATPPLMGANPPLDRLQVVDGLQGDAVECEQPMVQMPSALSVRVCRSVLSRRQARSFIYASILALLAEYLQ